MLWSRDPYSWLRACLLRACSRPTRYAMTNSRANKARRCDEENDDDDDDDDDDYR